MKISVEWLKEKSACSEGVEWFTAQAETDSIKVLGNLINENKLDWVNWLIVRLMTYKQYVSYAVYAAEQVIGIYEKQYPNDKRPRQAIEAAKKCIDDPSAKNKQSAWAAAGAAEAAWAAAWVAWAAAGAVGAVEAAWAAARAAWAAGAAEAAWAAAWAAREAMKKKILKYGIKLLAG